ncbi:TPA: hypothetical protein QCW01_005181 [Bacillus thuringiensis]|uniref:hypothetical protein n=1 Tax=Bacillus cereus group TaxID=86661 RepID=UPI001F565086|nr:MULTISPECIES: hypothetical protein [Bacillus cereus group]MEB9092873.1 hypothetical protein [Bacillus cereus]MED3480153.1 hypothetical protein [Bacillus thuringiensis]MEB9450721.1 hypothetical protein [Bacillus cereus]MEC3436107.1 hypothetical protein [Bacillus cereus]MED1549121.1 hypothetical protein [Bacillus paranthracis]
MPYISDEDLKLAKNHIKLLQDFNAELIKENLLLTERLFPLPCEEEEKNGQG